MRQHHPPRPAGRAGRVEDVGGVVGARHWSVGVWVCGCVGVGLSAAKLARKQG
jgi:hypothetical protein